MLQIRCLTLEDRARELQNIAGLVDLEPGTACPRNGLDAGMREFIRRINSISPDFVTISCCAGHGPEEMPGGKGMAAGHVALWLASETSVLAPGDATLVIGDPAAGGGGGIADVSFSYRRFSDGIRPLLSFGWSRRSGLESAQRDIEDLLLFLYT